MMTAMLILGAVALFVNLIAIVVLLALQIVMARDLRDVLTLEKINTGRIGNIERATLVIQALIASFISGQNLLSSPGPIGDVPPTPAGVKEVFETEDGRHQAGSLKELMEKVKNDPRYKTTNPDEIERLKKLLEQEVEDDKEPPTSPTDDFPEVIDDEDEEDRPDDIKR